MGQAVNISIDKATVRKLRSRLDGLAPEVRKKLIRSGMRQAWKGITAIAKANAPRGRSGTRRYKDSEFQSGRLAKSFSLRIVALRITGGKVLSARVLNTAPYAWLVEHGHQVPRPYHKGKPHSNRVKAQPFMWVGFQQHKEAAVGILTQEISDSLDEYFAGVK